MITRESIEGTEYDWLAVDAEGHVALFSTAGAGYVPEAFLQNVEAFDAAISMVISLPPTTSAECSRELPAGFTNTWKLVAERGLFAFDSDPHGGPYCLIAAPRDPVILNKLPLPVVDVVNKVALHGLSFKAATRVTQEDIVNPPATAKQRTS